MRLELSIVRCLGYLTLVVSASCGGGTTAPPPPPPPPPPAPLVLAQASPSGDGQTVIGGQAITSPLRAQVTRNGAPVSGQAVSWSATSGTITGNGPSNSEGVATAAWVLGPTAGTQTATAAAGTGMVQFTATATMAVPGVLAISAANPTGNGQSGSTGSRLPNELRVLVTRGGVPAGGELVIWQANDANAFLEPPMSTSASNGIATSAWTLGSAAGAQSATAFAGSLTGPAAQFIATATALPPGSATIKLYTSGGARFDPATLTVAAGTTVSFVWQDGFHDVTPTGTPTFVGVLSATDPPKSYQFTFTTPGTYRFYCDVHGTPTTGMRGTVIVQ
ncbi:MAG: plastocyanin/azurin family copper-binding protein [Gemmatimonadota bacterium]